METAAAVREMGWLLKLPFFTAPPPPRSPERRLSEMRPSAPAETWSSGVAGGLASAAERAAGEKGAGERAWESKAEAAWSSRCGQSFSSRSARSGVSASGSARMSEWKVRHAVREERVGENCGRQAGGGGGAGGASGDGVDERGLVEAGEEGGARMGDGRAVEAVEGSGDGRAVEAVEGSGEGRAVEAVKGSGEGRAVEARWRDGGGRPCRGRRVDEAGGLCEEAGGEQGAEVEAGAGPDAVEGHPHT